MRVFLAIFSFLSLAPQHLGSNDDVSARNTVAVVGSITPTLPDGVKFDIVGGDTYVRIRSQNHAVNISGYDNEPYVRILANGTVQVNDASSTTVLNGDRYGNVDLSTFTPSATPKWRTIASDGMVMWHDHRVHWMSPQTPAVIDNKGTVLTWDVPFTIDGAKFHAKGTLFLREQASRAWWLWGVVALLISIVLTLVKGRWAFIPVAFMSLAGVALGAAEYFGMPVGARTNGFLMWFALGAALLTAISVALEKNQRLSYASGPVMAGAGITLVVAALMNANQVAAAYVPGINAVWIARAVIPMLLGTGVVATVNGVMRAWRPMND